MFVKEGLKESAVALKIVQEIILKHYSPQAQNMFKYLFTKSPYQHSRHIWCVIANKQNQTSQMELTEMQKLCG